MQIQKIKLTDFRNFKSKLLEFSPATTVILGANASGKTNILEGLFLLATGKSFRARVEEEMVNYDAEIARISAVVSSTQHVESRTHTTDYMLPTTKLEVVLTRGLIDMGGDHLERVSRKKMNVNGVSKRLIDFAGNFKIVLFRPWDLGLVTEAPTHRRDFLDSVLSQVDREYRRSILSYEKGLRQRNRLLLRIREEGLSRTQLLFWNKLLIRGGDYISAKREDFIEFTNNTGSPVITNFQLEYDKSAISEGRLEQYAEEEIAAATTLVGPHRDDFIFKIKSKNNERDLARFGSRGEERMGVLWLKLAELAFIEAKTGERPTLLLDDIFSELDRQHRKIVTGIVGKQQTIITTADPHFIKDFKRVEKIKLSG
jgi:DNA replication and repair protein RecF